MFQLVLMAQRLVRRYRRSGGPRFKSHSRPTSQSWSCYQLNQLESKAVSDSTLKQLTTRGVSNTLIIMSCYLFPTLLLNLYMNSKVPCQLNELSSHQSHWHDLITPCHVFTQCKVQTWSSHNDVKQKNVLTAQSCPMSTGHFSWTRPDPAKRWPDPTRTCWPKSDPTRPIPTRGPILPPLCIVFIWIIIY